MSELRIGTSGWHYDSWLGWFYPKEVRKKELLRYYASQFDTAELNAPFYRTPTLEAVEAWAGDTHAGSASCGRRRASLPTGSGSRRSRRTASR